MLGGHFETLAADSSQPRRLQQAVGSLEGNVLVKARRFKELQATSGSERSRRSKHRSVPRMLQAPELTDGLPFPEGDTLDESH